MRFRAIFKILVLVLAGSAACRADGSTTVFDFLRSDMNARAGALAGSVFSLTDDPTLIFYNPAALGTLTVPRGTVSFFKNLLDVNAGSLAYGQSLGDLGWAGAGVQFQSYGSFIRTDEMGNAQGSFTASDLAASVGYANTLDSNLYWGATVKFIHSSIAEFSSSAVAGDVGLLYLIPDARLALGFSLRNLGRQLGTFLGTRETLPVDASVGFSIIPKGLPLLLNVAFHDLNQDVASFGDRFRSFSVGGEFTVSRVIQLRVGYNNEQRKDLNLGATSGLTGFSAGIGIEVKGYRVDYGLSSLGHIGSLHRVSVNAVF